MQIATPNGSLSPPCESQNVKKGILSRIPFFRFRHTHLCSNTYYLFQCQASKNTCLRQGLPGAEHERADTNQDSGHARENRFTVYQNQKAQTLPKAGRNRACHRPLQGGPPIREELLEVSLRRLHQCHACSCRIQLQKSHEVSFVPY